jgi:tRNA-binding EMAP/Myf-like protein
VSATPPTLSVCAAAKWIGAQKSGAKPSSAFDEAQTAQWIALGASAAEIGAFRTMGIIEESVRSRSYLVGTAVSVADYWVFYNVRALWTATAAPQLAKYFPCASRWVMHVAALCTAPLPEGVALPTPPPMGAALAQFKLADFEVKAPAVPAPAAGDAAKRGGKPTAKKGKPAGAKGGKKGGKPAGAEGGKKGGKKKEAKAKKAAKPAAAKAALAIDVLDLRVGKLVNVRNHHDTAYDKVYIEDVHLSDDGSEVRKVASGIRASYATPDMLEGKRCVIVYNLKPKKVGDYASHGMVLCAVMPDHSARILEPPADAPLGERLTVEGFAGDAKAPNWVTKKKATVKLAPDMRTDGAGVAQYKGIAFMTSTGAVTAEYKDAAIQ